MSKILAIDHGAKRTGLAITDDTATFAFGLTTVDTAQLWKHLDRIIVDKAVSEIVVGEPKRLNNEPAQWGPEVDKFVTALGKKYPSILVHRMDERFTSKMAFQTMIDGGLKKKDRRNKALVDEISATIILQSFLESRNE